jgi:hypothetical protein
VSSPQNESERPYAHMDDTLLLQLKKKEKLAIAFAEEDQLEEACAILADIILCYPEYASAYNNR